MLSDYYLSANNLPDKHYFIRYSIASLAIIYLLEMTIDKQTHYWVFQNGGQLRYCLMNVISYEQ